MRLRNTIGLVAAALVTSAWIVGSTQARVQEFFNKDEWVAAIGSFETIPFTGFPDGTFITDQYADLGILFAGGNEHIFLNQGFINDGARRRPNGKCRLTQRSTLSFRFTDCLTRGNRAIWRSMSQQQLT